MTGDADDDHSGPSLESLSSFHIDDAFSDGEDNDAAYTFSSAAMREEVAKNFSSLRMGWQDEETDGDTFVNGGPPESSNSYALSQSVANDLSLSVQPSEDPGSPSLDSANFVSISLSHSGPEFQEDRQTVEEETEAQEVQLDSYPSVIIDASRSPTHRVTLSSDSHGDIPELPVSNSQGRSSPVTPPLSFPPSPQSAHSTQSLPSPQATAITQGDAATASTSAIATVTTSGLAPPPLVESEQRRHKPSRSAGPSALEKFRSKTRPSFLPPKARKEDDKHMADWETMMKQSRATAEKRRKALQERRIAREKKIEESLAVWQKEVVPDWKVVQNNAALRRLWWRGIPTKLRASMWERAAGNPLALSKDSFRTCLARAKRALSAGTFPSTTLELMENDIRSTVPSLHIFHPETGPMYAELKDILCAWIVSRSDEGLGYTFGAAKIAGMLLINMPSPQAFVVMRNLLERHCLRSFFGGDGAKEDVEAYYRIFDTLLADGMPKIYFNFKQHQISPAAYLPDWLIPLFLDHLPFEACARLWDVIILEGDSFLYRAALAVLAVLEPRLFFPDRNELLELLRGENKAAIDIAVREGTPLDAGKYLIYGVDEETLWERIEGMEDWWKESTWTRLIRRELPDL